MIPPRDPTDSADREDSLFDAMPQLGWVARPDGWISYYNRAWLAYTGRTLDELRGWAWQAVHDPAYLPTVLERWRAALAAGEPFEMSFPLRRHDGVFRWFMTYATPIRGESGEIVRWIGVNTDIEEQKRAERALESGMQVRADVMAFVSHDLRNPLNTILMAATLIDKYAEDGSQGARIKKNASTVARAVAQMNRLVADLLDVTRLEANQALAIELETQDVVPLFEHSIEAARPMCTAKKITLDAVIPETPTVVVCDGDRLQQILGNLLDNALKFTRENGQIRVTVQPTAHELAIAVRDSGIGMRPEQLAHIFEPFWQADANRKRGSGLGLSIVKAIAEAHGGRVGVESVPDEGTTFHVVLPIAGPGRTMKEER